MSLLTRPPKGMESMAPSSSGREYSTTLCKPAMPSLVQLAMSYICRTRFRQASVDHTSFELDDLISFDTFKIEHCSLDSQACQNEVRNFLSTTCTGDQSAKQVECLHPGLLLL